MFRFTVKLVVALSLLAPSASAHHNEKKLDDQAQLDWAQSCVVLEPKDGLPCFDRLVEACGSDEACVAKARKNRANYVDLKERQQDAAVAKSETPATRPEQRGASAETKTVVRRPSEGSEHVVVETVRPGASPRTIWTEAAAKTSTETKTVVIARRAEVNVVVGDGSTAGSASALPRSKSEAYEPAGPIDLVVYDYQPDGCSSRCLQMQFNGLMSKYGELTFLRFRHASSPGGLPIRHRRGGWEPPTMLNGQETWLVQAIGEYFVAFEPGQSKNIHVDVFTLSRDGQLHLEETLWASHPEAHKGLYHHDWWSMAPTPR